MNFSTLLSSAANFIWSYPVVWGSLLISIYLTVRLRLIYFTGIRHTIDLLRGRYDHDDEPGHITHFQALTAALSGTVGIGNISGVAIAMAVGGPGALFWMWVTALLGMGTKFVECTLGTLFREKDEYTYEVRGGPMYYMSNHLGPKWKTGCCLFCF